MAAAEQAAEQREKQDTMASVSFRPSYFISGGQTGADSIPIAVYEELGVGMRGYLPEKCERDDGKGQWIAEQHGLWEGQGSYDWRDRANASMSDALLAFLVDKPMTGKGTMQTANLFVNGTQDFVVLEKPKGYGHRVIPPADTPPADQPQDPTFPFSHDKPKHPIDPAKHVGRPVLVFWDLSPENMEENAKVLHEFINTYRPWSLMVAGPVETTSPNIVRLGAELMLRALGGDAGSDAEAWQKRMEAACSADASMRADAR